MLKASQHTAVILREGESGGLKLLPGVFRFFHSLLNSMQRKVKREEVN